jgi:hypothetical protein
MNQRIDGSDVRRVLLAVWAAALPVFAFGGETALTPVLRDIHDAELREMGNGEWEFRSTGTDPYFFVETDGKAIDLNEQPMLAFDYFSAAGIGQMLVFVGPVLDIAHLLTINDVSRRESWAAFSADLTATIRPPTQPVTSLRITLGQRPGIVVRLRALRVRPPTEQERQLAAGREERLARDRQRTERLDAYLARTFPCAVASVTADMDTLTVEGSVAGLAGDAAPLLAEIPMWEDITALNAPPTLLPLSPDARGRFSVKLSRSEAADRDRLLSAWAVVRQRPGKSCEPLSAMRYADEVKARAALPPARPRPLKGLGGCPFDHPDMRALGLASVTLNIILNDLFADGPGPGRAAVRYAGRTRYVNDAAVARYDRDMRIAASNGWMVSAIVLMPPVRDAPPGAWIREAAHPEADPGGIFVLPNFTSREGVNAYAAAMDFLTERYARPDGAYGRVHHWIMHNEINSGFFWATAGAKTLTTYMELYQKSMRVACLLARQYDPNAKPLISLDHCWTHCPDPRAYPARGLLERLAAFSRKEGDFPWGIAFHPYPQDIANPRTWEDAQARFDFDTPFVTFRNLEVLDAWAERPDVAFRGREPREIQFTEQGLNSPDYSERSLRDHAAGLAYAWQKIKRMKHATAFQYHLWTDEPSEGGLRLGLRKFADDPGDPRGFKPAWHLFQALGTDREEAACRFALPVTGLAAWDDVWRAGPIGDPRAPRPE